MPSSDRISVSFLLWNDSQVDLAEEGEVRYADKGYFGAKTKGYDAAMKKSNAGPSYKDEMRNKRISRKRSPVERFYAFIKCVCKAAHVAVTAIPRIRVKMIITGIVFNANHLASAKSNCRHSGSCRKNMMKIRDSGGKNREN